MRRRRGPGERWVEGGREEGLALVDVPRLNEKKESRPAARPTLVPVIARRCARRVPEQLRLEKGGGGRT